MKTAKTGEVNISYLRLECDFSSTFHNRTPQVKSVHYCSSPDANTIMYTWPQGVKSVHYCSSKDNENESHERAWSTLFLTFC